MDKKRRDGTTQNPKKTIIAFFLSPTELLSARESCLRRKWSGRGLQIGLPLRSVQEKHRENPQYFTPNSPKKRLQIKMHRIHLHMQQTGAMLRQKSSLEGFEKGLKSGGETLWRSQIQCGCGSMRCDTQTTRISSRHLTLIIHTQQPLNTYLNMTKHNK